MFIPEEKFQQAKNLLSSARKIVIISHRGPDGDTVGANLALRLALKEQWHKEVVSACADPLPRNCLFLADCDAYVRDFDWRWADLIVSVDCGAHYMMKFHETKPEMLGDFLAAGRALQKTAAPRKPFLNIDHHPSNDHFGTLNIVDSDAAAACQIIYRLLIFCGFKIDRRIATCLLQGLYYDTGSFMHSNVNPEVLEIAASLMWKGADFKKIARAQFHTMPVTQLKIYGIILERARLNSQNKVAVSALRWQDFAAVGAAPDDTTGSIDYLNSIPDGEFCCLVYEDRNGSLKGSFRSRADDIDLSKLAGLFGGGGHKKASGFSFPGRLREVGGKITIDK